MKKFLVALTLALVLALGCVVIASADYNVSANAVVAYGDLSSITSIDGHKVVPITNVNDLFSYTPATCSEYGTAIFYCADAEHAKKNGSHAVLIKMDNHSWQEVDKIPATCTEDGTTQLVCKVCGKVGSLVTKKANGHQFTTKVAYFIEPTCTEYGYGYRVCNVCGAAETTKGPKDLEEAKKYEYLETEFAGKKIFWNATQKWVRSNAISHKYTDWKISEYGNCYHYGKATRTCINCGDIQYVGGDKDVNKLEVVVKKADGTILEQKAIAEADAAKESVYQLKDVLEGVRKFNIGYPEAYNEFKKYGFTFTSYADLEKVVGDALKKGTFELQSDVYVGCYTRKVTYVCPACKSLKEYDKNATATSWYDTPQHDGIHPPIVVTMNVETHVWKAKPESSVELKDAATGHYYDVADYKKLTAVGLKETEGKPEELRKVYTDIGYATSPEKGVTPNCVLPGYNLYKCEKENTHGAYDYKLEYLYNTGHDWSDWKTVETYTLNGKNYKVQSHICNTCKVEEHETVEYTPDPALNGLVLVGDEFLYFVDDEWQDEFTGVVEYDGQKFYVVDGVVDGTKNGLTLIDGQFVYLIENRLATEVNQVVLYDGEWFKVVNGVLDTKMPAGLYDYDGGKFIFAAGRLINDYTGLWLNPLDNDWYYIKAGSGFDSSFTGETVYDGATFQVVNGKLAK